MTWPVLPRLNPCLPCVVKPAPRDPRKPAGPNWWKSVKCSHCGKKPKSEPEAREFGIGAGGHYCQHCPDEIPETDILDEYRSKKRRNPKLMVLNPGDVVLASVERRLGRRLTGGERAAFETARREFKTFQGRDVTAKDLVPVSAPPGTPLFVSMIGRLDRMDYTVEIDSDRKGGWTHKAGDHGRKKMTRPPYLVAIPGRKKHNYTIVEPKGSHTYFKPTHGLMG